MDDEVKKIIGESYKRLPFDLKKTIVSSETRQRLQAVVERHQLYSDQADDLEMETTLVMLGLRPPTDFITNVKNALNVSEEKARAIAEDINAEIFRPVRESLKKIHGITSDQQPTTSNPQPITQTTPVIPAIPKPPTPIVPKPPIPPPPTTDLQPTTYNQQPKLAEKEKTPLERTTPGGHYENGENHLNREEILAGIENPAPARPARIASVASSASIASKPGTGNIVQDKLEGMVRMPKEETDLSKEYSADPYREPLG